MSAAPAAAATGAATDGGGLLVLTRWLHHDVDVDHPRLCVGDLAVDVVADDVEAVVEGLHAAGVRRVRLPVPVHLDPAAGAVVLGRLRLLLALTARGLVVEWEAVLGPEPRAAALLNHVFPPSAVLDRDAGDPLVRRWQGDFYLCKCVWRRGPGFLEVRDRRSDRLVRFVLDEAAHLAAVAELVPGAPVQGIPGAVLADLRGEELLFEAGGQALWLPYRVRQWPDPVLLV